MHEDCSETSIIVHFFAHLHSRILALSYSFQNFYTLRITNSMLEGHGRHHNSGLLCLNVDALTSTALVQTNIGDECHYSLTYTYLYVGIRPPRSSVRRMAAQNHENSWQDRSYWWNTIYEGIPESRS